MTMSSGLRVLVAEDDVVQRDALVRWIGELQPGWRVVATAGSVDEVTAAIEECAPDLCLVDLHLAGAPSGDWVKSLDARLPIVFVTGDPDFAVHAFDSAAIDYVLKPITLRRLKVALDRAAADPRLSRKPMAVGSGSGDAEGGLAAGGGGAGLKWLTMSRGNEVLVVSPREIIFLEADLKYTRVVCSRGEGLVRTGINELCDRFADDQFVKIHRSVVVNLRYVASVKRGELGHLDVYLKDRSDVLRVSKTFQHVFKSF